MDSDKKQLLLNINGEAEVVVTRKEFKRTVWALVIIVSLLTTLTVGGVLAAFKIILDLPDTHQSEASFLSETGNGKVEKVTVNVDKNMVEYHAIGDVSANEPEVLTVHDFQENWHVIKVIDADNANKSKCYVGTLDRRTAPTPSDIMRFATADSADRVPVHMELHYEAYDWLNVETSILGPVYHNLCFGLETAFIFPAYDEDDPDLLLDATAGQESISVAEQSVDVDHLPAIYTYSYVIDHYRDDEDASGRTRFRRSVDVEDDSSPETSPAPESPGATRSNRLNLGHRWKPRGGFRSCQRHCPGRSTPGSSDQNRKRRSVEVEDASSPEPSPAPASRGATRSRMPSASRWKPRGRARRSERSADGQHDQTRSPEQSPEQASRGETRGTKFSLGHRWASRGRSLPSTPRPSDLNRKRRSVEVEDASPSEPSPAPGNPGATRSNRIHVGHRWKQRGPRDIDAVRLNRMERSADGPQDQTRSPEQSPEQASRGETRGTKFSLGHRWASRGRRDVDAVRLVRGERSADAGQGSSQRNSQQQQSGVLVAAIRPAGKYAPRTGGQTQGVRVRRDVEEIQSSNVDLRKSDASLVDAVRLVRVEQSAGIRTGGEKYMGFRVAAQNGARVNTTRSRRDVEAQSTDADVPMPAASRVERSADAGQGTSRRNGQNRQQQQPQQQRQNPQDLSNVDKLRGFRPAAQHAPRVREQTQGGRARRDVGEVQPSDAASVTTVAPVGGFRSKTRAVSRGRPGTRGTRQRSSEE